MKRRALQLVGRKPPLAHQARDELEGPAGAELAHQTRIAVLDRDRGGGLRRRAVAIGHLGGGRVAGLPARRAQRKYRRVQG